MDSSSIRILIAEDEPAHAESLARSLHDSLPQVLVRTVGSLREFRDAVSAEAPDLAIVDMLLPDGQADSVLTSPPEAGPFPVMVLANRGDEDLAVGALRNGAIDYVIKSAKSFGAIARIAERAMLDWRLRTERRRAVQLQSLTVEILAILNTPIPLPDAISRILAAIKRETGFDSVKIRLKNGGEFHLAGRADSVPGPAPAEDSPIGALPGDAVSYDADGRMSLTCSCGIQFTPGLAGSDPQLTPGGSIWTNDLQAYPRSVGVAVSASAGSECLHGGYQSLALIPIRVETELIGILQLNDRGRSSFTSEQIVFFEGIAASFGVALLRKRDDQARRDSEENLRTLLNVIPETLFLMEPDGTVLAANETFAARMGISLASCPGRSIFSLVPPDAGERRRRWVEEVVRTGRPAIHEDTRAGHRFRHHVYPVMNTTGVVDRLVVLVVDVTTQREVEDALRNSEERYRDLVETTFDWIWEVDAQGRYIYSTGKVRDLLGYSPQEILGLTPFDFMPESEASRVEPIFRECVALGRPLQAIQNVNRHKDGRLVVLETSGVPLFGPDGSLCGYRGMDRDITDRKRLEEQLRQAQKLEAIGQLAGGVAHDFNNILAATMMHLGLLQASPKLDADMRRALQELEGATKRAASLTRQLLMFSRRSVLAVKPVDLNEIISNLLRMLRRLIGEHIDLRFDSRTGLPLVEADAGMLEQVMMNLVVNARDAMPRGGRITIGTERREIEDIAVQDHQTRRTGHFACISVTDTGCGMDAATLSRIFEPFFTTKEPGSGTGLGLATVHGIVAQHKGWIEVDSEVGIGTTFRVFLPVLDRTETAQVVVQGVDAWRRGKETILMVEDDANVRNMAARSLRALGYHVIEASNGREAVKLWQIHESEVSLLFTDMVMPEGISGLELHEQLRALRPGLKTVISSGYSAEIVHAGIPTMSGVTYLPKPYDVPVLARIIREVLDRKA